MYHTNNDYMFEYVSETRTSVVFVRVSELVTSVVKSLSTYPNLADAAAIEMVTAHT